MVKDKSEALKNDILGVGTSIKAIGGSSDEVAHDQAKMVAEIIGLLDGVANESTELATLAYHE